VTLLTDEVLFPSGSATLEPGATPLLTIISEVLTKLNNPVKVIGHTDTDAIHTAQFPSNRYLSAARASAVVDFFAAHGIPSERLEASGRGFDVPITPNDTDVGKRRNRRVEIVVESQLIESTLNNAGLGNNPVDSSAPPAPSVQPNLSPNLGGGGH
jgi:chemotaxis protein MotB